MKKYLFILLVFMVSSASAQITKFTIKGVVANTDSIKYAYLTTISQQVPISNEKIFMVTPVVDGKFEFSGTFDLEGKDYQYASVFVEERGNISKEEALSKFRNLIWVTGRRRNARLLVLENLTLSIDEYGKTKESKVIDGGILTKQDDEYKMAIRAGGRQLISFIKKYPDSPISYYCVKETTSLFDAAHRDRFISLWGSPSELFNELSPKLKNSKRGIELKESIDAKAKL
ncbi:hypothetical protein CA265_24205 [Sphingobacteriaceae bacterium GW460-11-11-14-LB5]|nr:hypothetical protein CA265_24205 [Sphingobacteriaceae bacterium GW460-11-11-14-LB5]